MQEKKFDINEDGYSVRCLAYYDGDFRSAEDVVIATYGFGGNKENHAVRTFAERLIGKYKGFLVVTFDWPCHGQDARKKLLLSECLEYLDLVTAYVEREWNPAHLFNYSSSFGAYITLLDLKKGKSRFERIGLRCPAIRMYDAITGSLTPEEEEKLEKKGRVMLGFERKMEITKEFLDDLKDNDLTKMDFLDEADRILMVHGTKDQMIPFDSVKQFSEDNVIDLIPAEGADHPFSNPKHMDLAISEIIRFFRP